MEPTQAARQIRAQRLLAECGFPTPDLLCLVDACPEVNGRRFAVQRFVESEPDDLVDELDESSYTRFVTDLGAAVGTLHSVRLPYFDGWVDYRGRPGPTWADTIRPTDAFRTIHDQGTVFPQELLREVERRIERGLAALPPVEPRLVHRDLHLGNTLLMGGRFGGLIDFELVKEWDFVYDFNRLAGLFETYVRFDGCREPFMKSYQDVAGVLPASFPLRHWLYRGIGLVLGIEAFLEGNDGYVKRPDQLAAWLDLPVPLA